MNGNEQAIWRFSRTECEGTLRRSCRLYHPIPGVSEEPALRHPPGDRHACFGRISCGEIYILKYSSLKAQSQEFLSQILLFLPPESPMGTIRPIARSERVAVIHPKDPAMLGFVHQQAGWLQELLFIVAGLICLFSLTALVIGPRRRGSWMNEVDTFPTEPPFDPRKNGRGTFFPWVPVA